MVEASTTGRDVSLVLSQINLMGTYGHICWMATRSRTCLLQHRARLVLTLKSGPSRAARQHHQFCMLR